MPILLWDACGLVKRYVPETGSETTNALFSTMPRPAMIGTFWGCTETYAILVRRHNSGRMSAVDLEIAVSALYNEIVHSQDFDLLSISDEMVMASFANIRAHNLNSVDATLLTAFLEYQASLPEGSPDCVLVTADLRLIRAATAEGLQTLNPEALTSQEVTALLSSLR